VIITAVSDVATYAGEKEVIVGADVTMYVNPASAVVSAFIRPGTVSLFVTTLTDPEAPLFTVAWIIVAETTVKVIAGVLPKRTASTFVKPVPVIVTTELVGAEIGKKLLMLTWADAEVKKADIMTNNKRATPCFRGYKPE
jgi:hypothetical protein